MSVNNERNNILNISNNLFEKKAFSFEFNKKWYGKFCKIDIEAIDVEIWNYFNNEILEIERLVANGKGDIAVTRLDKFTTLAISDFKFEPYGIRVQKVKSSLLCQSYFGYILSSYKNSNTIVSILKDKNFKIDDCFKGRSDWYNKSLKSFLDFDMFCIENPDTIKYVEQVSNHFKINKIDNNAHILFYLTDSIIQIKELRRTIRDSILMRIDTISAKLSNRQYVEKVNNEEGNSFSFLNLFFQNYNYDVSNNEFIINIHREQSGFNLIITKNTSNLATSELILNFKKVAMGRFVISKHFFYTTE